MEELVVGLNAIGGGCATIGLAGAGAGGGVLFAGLLLALGTFLLLKGQLFQSANAGIELVQVIGLSASMVAFLILFSYPVLADDKKNMYGMVDDLIYEIFELSMYGLTMFGLVAVVMLTLKLALRSSRFTEVVKGYPRLQYVLTAVRAYTNKSMWFDVAVIAMSVAGWAYVIYCFYVAGYWN
jgi:hypothetical protein